MIGRWRRSRANRPSPHELVPPEGVPLTLEVAGVGVRLGAQILDVLITTAAFVGVILLMSALNLSGGNTFDAVLSLLFFFIRIPYYVLSELAWNGQTIGKRLTSIKVVAHDGGSLTPHALVARNLMKEAEIFLPGTLIFVMTGDDPLSGLIAFLWICVAFAVPLSNRRRRRIGDMIAGTYVIHLPVPILLRDVAKEAQRMPALQEKFAFLPNQLDHYGAYELQTLEDLLRAQKLRPGSDRDAKARAATLAAVVEKIRAKVQYPEAIAPADHRQFLQAFYNAQRAHLEARQLFGDRRADKHHGAVEDNF